ncbi:MAG: sulfatase-like hydrolase/transferase [Pseudomonadota bacterium]
MLKKWLLALVVMASVAAGLAWINRAAILTEVALNRVKAGHYPVAEHRRVAWEQGPEEATLAPSERPPNIIFILLDDLGINDLSTFGGGVADGRVRTPSIDQLARDGAIYTQAYSGTGTCAPSRAMLLTGRYPTRTGFEFTPTPDGMGRVVSLISNGMDAGSLPKVDYNRAAVEEGLPYAEKGLPSSEVTLAEVLQTHGYHTAHIGKWHLGRVAGSTPNAQGFNESLMMDNLLFLPEADPRVVNAKLDFDPIDQFLWATGQYSASFNGSEPFEPGGYLTDWWTDESLRVIEANRNRPFFLYLAHWAVHTPLQATREDYEAVGDIQPHRLRVYAAMLRALDRSVERIVAKLEEEGLSDNTIIIVSSDNGGAGYVGLPQINAPYRGWKITLFEGGIRVPMFVKWPAEISPGTRVDSPVAHIDVMPSLAAAAGARLPAGIEIDGQNILPAATGEGTISRPNDAIFWQSGDYKVVRAGHWKLHVDGLQDKVWLFDLANDPTEQRNLADERPGKLAELQTLLAEHHADAVDPLYPHTLVSPIRIDKTLADPFLDADEYILWPN